MSVGKNGITESGVWVLAALVGVALAVECGISHEWLGVGAGLFAAWNALSARYYLVRWKPSATKD